MLNRLWVTLRELFARTISVAATSELRRVRHGKLETPCEY